MYLELEATELALQSKLSLRVRRIQKPGWNSKEQNWSLGLGSSLCQSLTFFLSRGQHTVEQSPPLQLVCFISSELHRLDWTQGRNRHSTTLPLRLSSHSSSFSSLSLFFALNDTVYTHPASIILFHTSPGLFICLWCWGDMEAHSLLTFSRSPFILRLSSTTSGCLWALIYEALLNPGGPVWSTQGEFVVAVRTPSKDRSQLFHYLF